MHRSLNDEEILEVSGQPDVNVLIDLYKETQNDLGDWLQQRQRDYETRRNIWEGKSYDFRKHAVDSETGQVFPFDGAADHEILEIDDHIRAHKSMLMNSLRRAHIVATPVEHNDVQRASVISNFMRWLINAKMTEYYDEMDFAADNFLEKGMMVTYTYWDSADRTMQREISLEELQGMFGPQMEAFMTGEMDDQLVQMLIEGVDVSEKKARKMLDEIRTEGKTTIPMTVQSRNQPCIRTLAPDEDFFLPPWAIDSQKVPYAFHVIPMTPEEIKSRGEKEGWDEEFVEAASELSGTRVMDDVQFYRQEENYQMEDYNDDTVRIVYCYQRLLDEDNVPGIYCTIFAYGVPELYGKHYLLDYAHGEFPFTVTPLERTTKRLYGSRSYPEIAASAQQIIKAETDASIDNLSMSTLPPLLHPPGKRPTRWGPGVQVSVFRPDQYQYAPTPPNNPASFAMREEVRMMTNKYFGRNDQEADPVEIQAKQQDLVNRFLGHQKKVFNQVYSLYQQFGQDAEYFRVVGVNQMEKYEKGRPGERFDFWIEFDVTTQDPAQMVERVKGIAQLAQILGKGTTLDGDKLFQIGVGALMPGASDQVIMPAEQGIEKAQAEERQAIAELVAGTPPNVRENDSHQAKLQVFEQWLQRPDTQQKMQANEALAADVQNYYKQRQFQLQQQQNAVTGRLGGQNTGYGMTTQQ